MYQPVTAAELRRCYGPRPAVQVFYNVCALLWRARGLRSDGIYNRRPVRGSTSVWSLHAVGRAVDLGVPAGQKGLDLGNEIAVRCIAHHDALGIGEVIWNRHRWSTEHGYVPYDGLDPHTSHVHIGFTIDFADKPATDALAKWIAGALTAD